MRSYSTQWALALYFFFGGGGGVGKRSFFIKNISWTDWILNSLQVFSQHRLLEWISYTSCWTKHFSVPCQLYVSVLRENTGNDHASHK